MLFSRERPVPLEPEPAAETPEEAPEAVSEAPEPVQAVVHPGLDQPKRVFPAHGESATGPAGRNIV